MVQPLQEAIWQLLKKLNIKPPYDPATPPPRELKAYIRTDIHTNGHSSTIHKSQTLETT